jgi:hypothetical protein
LCRYIELVRLLKPHFKDFLRMIAAVGLHELNAECCVSWN